MKYLIFIIIFFFSYQLSAQEEFIYCEVWGAKQIKTQDEWDRDEIKDVLSKFPNKIKVSFEIYKDYENKPTGYVQVNIKDNNFFGKLAVVPRISNPINMSGYFSYSIWKERQGSGHVLTAVDNGLGSLLKIENHYFQYYSSWWPGANSILVYGGNCTRP